MPDGSPVVHRAGIFPLPIGRPTQGRAPGRRLSLVVEKAPNGVHKEMVGLSDAHAEKWPPLLNQIASAKLRAAAPRTRSTTVDYGTVARLSQRQKHLDESETERIIALYQSGSSVYELAEQFGCHRQTVSRRLRSRGVQMRGSTLGRISSMRLSVFALLVSLWPSCRANRS